MLIITMLKTYHNVAVIFSCCDWFHCWLSQCWKLIYFLPPTASNKVILLVVHWDIYELLQCEKNNSQTINFIKNEKWNINGFAYNKSGQINIHIYFIPVYFLIYNQSFFARYNKSFFSYFQPPSIFFRKEMFIAVFHGRDYLASFSPSKNSLIIPSDMHMR